MLTPPSVHVMKLFAETTAFEQKSEELFTPICNYNILKILLSALLGCFGILAWIKTQ